MPCDVRFLKLFIFLSQGCCSCVLMKDRALTHLHTHVHTTLHTHVHTTLYISLEALSLITYIVPTTVILNKTILESVHNSTFKKKKVNFCLRSYAWMRTTSLRREEPKCTVCRDLRTSYEWFCSRGHRPPRRSTKMTVPIKDRSKVADDAVEGRPCC